MTLDGFLTVLALLAAIYAVLPAAQRLRLGLAWKTQAVLGVIAVGLILALELYEVRPPVCPISFGELCQFLALPEGETGSSRKAAFLVAFAWLGLSVVVHKFSRPSLGGLTASTKLAVELIDDEQYGDALTLLAPRMDLLAKASRRQCRRQRLHDWLADFGPTDPNSFRAFARRPGDRKYSGETWPKWLAKPVTKLAILTPQHDRSEAAASDMLQMLFNNSQLLTYIVERRPYFGLALIKADAYGAADFCERFLSRLIAAPGSALYHELSTNLVTKGPVTYELPSRNRLLHYLFADANHAVRLSAWQGVGNYITRLLDGDEDPEYWDWLNDDQAWFDNDQLHDPIFMAMIFFDIMVRAAADQGVLGHMWLYYLDRFVGGLTEGYDSSGAGIDRTAEFPIRAARLIYELTQIVSNWVELFGDLPEDSIHREFPARRESPGSIPHAAATALGTILAHVVHADEIEGGVALTINLVVLRTIRSCHPDDGPLSQMRAWLIEAILSAGHMENRMRHYERLADLLADTDYMLRHEVADYAEALEARLHGPG